MPPSLDVDLIVSDERWNSVPGLERIAALASAAVAAIGVGSDRLEVAIALSSDDEVRQLNRTYRGKDGATNVLSFPSAGAAEPTLLGDVILAYVEGLQDSATLLAAAKEAHWRGSSIVSNWSGSSRRCGPRPASARDG